MWRERRRSRPSCWCDGAGHDALTGGRWIRGRPSAPGADPAGLREHLPPAPPPPRLRRPRNSMGRPAPMIATSAAASPTSCAACSQCQRPTPGVTWPVRRRAPTGVCTSASTSRTPPYPQGLCAEPAPRRGRDAGETRIGGSMWRPPCPASSGPAAAAGRRSSSSPSRLRGCLDLPRGRHRHPLRSSSSCRWASD